MRFSPPLFAYFTISIRSQRMILPNLAFEQLKLLCFLVSVSYQDPCAFRFLLYLCVFLTSHAQSGLKLA